MTRKVAARSIAILLLAQLVLGPLVNFSLLSSVRNSVFLAEAAAHDVAIGLGIMLGLVAAGCSVAIAIAAWPIVGERSRAMARCLFALAVANVAVAALEYVGVFSMRSLSHAYAAASDRGAIEAIAPAIAAARVGAHFLGLVFAGGVAFTLYAPLFRYSLVPRAIAGFGLAASASEMIATAMPLFGQPVVFALIAPLGLAHLALVAWLLVKGFADTGPGAG
ncbi:MAG: DUF4386 family protein [Rhodanobacteraceae bacterium]